MTQDEAKTIAKAVAHAIDAALGKVLTDLSSGHGKKNGGPPEISEFPDPYKKLIPLPAGGVDDFEALYQKFKRRLLDECRVDPILLNLLTTQPAIDVQVEPRIETLQATTGRGRVARLMAKGFFAETRATGTVRRELARTGADPGGGGGLGVILNDFVKDGFLVRDGDGYQIAPGVKVTETQLEAR